MASSVLMTLLVKLGLDPSEFSKEADKASEKATTTGEKIQAGLGKIGGAVVAGAAAGLGALTTGLGFSIKAAADAEEVSAQLEAVLRSTGGAAGVTAEQAQNLAENFGWTTKFEDDAVLSGENLLLTFTNIGKDVFPLTTQTMLDMSTAMGQDLKSSALQLGKALNNPSEGMTALTRVGVAFTDEQKKQAEAMQAAGDIAGAQGIILAELQKEFGGAAEAAGSTFSGQLEIAKNALGNAGETIGTALLPVLTDLTSVLVDKLSSPEAQAAIQNIADKIADFASKAIEQVPKVIDGVKNFVDFLQNNQGIVVGVFAALGVAAVVWGVTTAAAAWAAITPLLPAIAVILLIAAVVALLYTAWTNNFNGIRDVMTGIWNDYLMPVFETVKEWLDTNLPIALQWLSNTWETVLLPAITKVWEWINANLVPLFATVKAWLAEYLPKALEKLSDFWENVLLPAIKRVWAWLQDPLFPFFESLANLLKVVVGKATEKLADIWENTLQPAIKTVYKWLVENLWPKMQDVATWFDNTFGKSIEKISAKLKDILGGAFEWAGSKVDWLTGALRGLTEWINNLTGQIDSTRSGLTKNPHPETTGFASGGWAPPGFHLVGEQGPEIVWFPSDGYVYNNNETSDIMDSSSSGGATGAQITVNNYQVREVSDPVDDIRTLQMLYGSAV